jgi:hypothetical protein
MEESSAASVYQTPSSSSGGGAAAEDGSASKPKARCFISPSTLALAFSNPQIDPQIQNSKYLSCLFFEIFTIPPSHSSAFTKIYKIS